MNARRLKIFRAHLGFYDSIVAAPSQKAALEAWGAGTAEFAKGFAEVTTDPDAVQAALAHPGEVLRRPFGSKGHYKIEAEPVRAPKLSPRSGTTSAAAAAQKKKRRESEKRRRAAERDVEQAKQEEIRKLSALKKRQGELEREMQEAREKARQKIARAKARMSGRR